MEQQITIYDKRIKMIVKTNEVCQRVQHVEGIGPITAIAFCQKLKKSFSSGMSPYMLLTKQLLEIHTTH
jgi:transposase